MKANDQLQNQLNYAGTAFKLQQKLKITRHKAPMLNYDLQKILPTVESGDVYSIYYQQIVDRKSS